MAWREPRRPRWAHGTTPPAEFSAESAGKVRPSPTPADTGQQDWPAPIGDKHWTDRQGHRRMRGGLLTARQARRLFGPPDVDNLHLRQAILIVQESC